MKTPLFAVTIFAIAITAKAQNTSTTGGSSSQSASGAGGRALTTQPAAGSGAALQSGSGVTQRGTGIVQPTTGQAGTQTGTAVGTGTSVGAGTGTTIATPTIPTTGTATEGASDQGTVAAPIPGAVTEPIPGSGPFVPGSLTTEGQDFRVEEPSGARSTVIQQNQTAESQNAANQRAASDLQARAFSEQVSSAIQLGGTSRVFFQDANSVITLDSTDGVVTMRGLVATPEQRLAIQRAVSGLPNVVQVNNELEIANQTGTNESGQAQRVPLQPLQPVPSTIPDRVE